MSCFCSGVSWIRTISLSLFMAGSHNGGENAIDPTRPMARQRSQDRFRGDTLLELLHGQLDRVTFLPDFLLHQLLLLRGQVDADDLFVVLHSQTPVESVWRSVVLTGETIRPCREPIVNSLVPIVKTG